MSRRRLAAKMNREGTVYPDVDLDDIQSATCEVSSDFVSSCDHSVGDSGSYLITFFLEPGSRTLGDDFISYTVPICDSQARFNVQLQNGEDVYTLNRGSEEIDVTNKCSIKFNLKNTDSLSTLKSISEAVLRAPIVDDDMNSGSERNTPNTSGGDTADEPVSGGDTGIDSVMPGSSESGTSSSHNSGASSPGSSGNSGSTPSASGSTSSTSGSTPSKSGDSGSHSGSSTSGGKSSHTLPGHVVATDGDLTVSLILPHHFCEEEDVRHTRFDGIGALEICGRTIKQSAYCSKTFYFSFISGMCRCVPKGHRCNVEEADGEDRVGQDTSIYTLGFDGEADGAELEFEEAHITQPEGPGIRFIKKRV